LWHQGRSDFSKSGGGGRTGGQFRISKIKQRIGNACDGEANPYADLRKRSKVFKQCREEMGKAALGGCYKRKEDLVSPDLRKRGPAGEEACNFLL